MPFIFKDNLESIIARGADYLSLSDLDLIRRAYEFTVNSIKRHRFVRMSGEPAIIHPLAVAETLVDWRMDGAAIAAGILHDVIEDPKISEFQLHATFKDEVSFLIKGVTKLRQFELKPHVTEDTAYHHRLFLASASDIRVAIIKLADRLHNMRTLEFLKHKKQIKNCVETQNVFIPLARFLGMKQVKDEYEDIALFFLNPEGYKNADEAFQHTREREDLFFSEIAEKIHAKLLERNINSRVVRWHYNLAHFHDECLNAMPLSGEKLSGFLTVVTHDELSCYNALGVVHSLYEPRKDKFEDTVQFPSADLKRWIETHVHEAGMPFKVRIVSEEMYHVNKLGIIPYLAAPSELERTDFLQDRLREIHDIMKSMNEQDEMSSAVEYLAGDLFRNEIFVITERQDRISLPPDSTVLDFAYHLNPVEANHFKRAVVNTRQVGIQYRLQSCDKVEIVADPNVRPRVDWLSHARTPFARMTIKKALAEQPRRSARGAGKNLLTKAVSRIGLVHTGRPEELENLILPVAEFLEMKTLNEFFEAVGYGDIAIEDAIEALRSQRKRAVVLADEHRLPIITEHVIFDREYPRETVQGERMPKSPLRLCEFCAPIPGDEIHLRASSKHCVAHRSDCRLLNRRGLWIKKISATWNDTSEHLYPARLRLKIFHRENTHEIIRGIIAEKGARFVALQTGSGSGDGLEMLEIIVETADMSMLENIIAGLIKLEDMVLVVRI